MSDKENKIYDIIVLGGGPAGMNAALYAKRGNADVVIIDTSTLGGQPVNYLEIENYLGFASIEGWELAEKFEHHIDKFNIPKFMMEEIKETDLVSDIKTIKTLKGEYKARTVIIATGASAAKLGIKGELEHIGKGVSYCAVCDGAFYRDKTVAVVGGGNAAVEEACYLTKFAKKVYIIHRRDELRADKIVQERAFKNEKIEFVFDTVPLEINPNENGCVGSVKIQNVKTKEIKDLSVDGVFPYIGFVPNVQGFSGQMMQDEKGFIKVDETMRTSTMGVFAAGDVRVTPLRQVITAVADGAIAGVSAVKYVEEIKTEEEQWLAYLSGNLNKEEMEELFKMNRSIEEINKIVDIVMTDDDVLDAINDRILAQQLENLKMQRAHENGVKKVAKEMLKKGFGIKEIAELTGLEESEVTSLKEE